MLSIEAAKMAALVAEARRILLEMQRLEHGTSLRLSESRAVINESRKLLDSLDGLGEPLRDGRHDGRELTRA